MQCPRCGTEMAEGVPCPRCGARVRHLRLGTEPDFTVRRLRLDTPPHLRNLASGLPRLRQRVEGALATRGKAYALALGAVAALVVGFGIFLAATGGGSSGASALAPSPSPDAAPPAWSGAPEPRIMLPLSDPSVPPAPGLVSVLPPVVGAPSVVPCPPTPLPAPPTVELVPPPPGAPSISGLPIGRIGLAVPGDATPQVPASVLQIAAVPPGAVAASCSPTPCRADSVGWVVADRARELLDTDPGLAACWAEETVRQGRKFNVPAMVASGYFHLGLAFRELGCRERAHGAFLSALCEGRTAIRPSLLDGYRQSCDRTGDGCDAPCRDDRYIVSDQPPALPAAPPPPPVAQPAPAAAPTPAPAASSAPAPAPAAAP